MTRTYDNLENGPSVLASLRRLMPTRPLLFSEALRVAELQASRLLELTGTTDGPVPDEAITTLPRMRVEYRDIPTSGLSFWDGQCWVICLNRSEPVTRQRFTLFHEYKHIIDHNSIDLVYRGNAHHSAREQAEHAADYFAGCALMPKSFLKRAWGSQIQRPTALARLFDVSPLAVAVRLAQVGLSEPVERCATVARRPIWPKGRRYHRQLSAHWPIAPPLEAVA